MTHTETLRLALEALETCGEDERGQGFNDALVNEAIITIKAALEAKDEPDQYAIDIECTKCGAKQSGVLTVHTTPPQRKPLTDEELRNHYQSNEWLDGVRFAEQFHGIKGEA